MRPFEFALIAVNASSLLLCFRRYSQTVWLGIVGANLAVLLLHGLVEGFRYQMVFSYLFVGLLAAYTLTKTNVRLSSAKIPKALRVIAVGLSIACLALTAFLAYTLPVFTLPKPTGTYDLGVQYLHLVDEKRNDPFLDKAPRKRELMVKVYYPAKKDDGKPFAPYFHNNPQLIRGFTGFYRGIPGFVFDHLRLAKTHAKEDLQISDAQPTYPVVLFSHGAGGTMEVQVSESEDLASHGYIVVAIDHTYVSAATAFPDRITSSSEATTDFHVGEPAEVISQIMADDCSFVMDKLEEMNAGKVDSLFEGRLNLDKIGAMGHSVGGAAAYNLAIRDSRVKAAVNLDGRVYVSPKGNPSPMAPFLMVANDRNHVQSLQNRESLLKKFEALPKLDQEIMISMYGSKEAYDDAYQKSVQAVQDLAEVLRASGNLFTLHGSDHMMFTDIGLFFGFKPARELIGIRADIEPAKCLEIASRVTSAFFDQHLKGETNGSLDFLAQAYPELEKVDLN